MNPTACGNIEPCSTCLEHTSVLARGGFGVFSGLPIFSFLRFALSNIPGCLACSMAPVTVLLVLCANWGSCSGISSLHFVLGLCMHHARVCLPLAERRRAVRREPHTDQLIRAYLAFSIRWHLMRFICRPPSVFCPVCRPGLPPRPMLRTPGESASLPRGGGQGNEAEPKTRSHE